MNSFQSHLDKYASLAIQSGTNISRLRSFNIGGFRTKISKTSLWGRRKARLC